MKRINISDLDITEQEMINRDQGYIHHNDGRGFFFEYYISPFEGRMYKAIPTESHDGEPLMDAEWMKVEFK